MGIFEFINNFLTSKRGTIFSLRMEFVSAFLSLSLRLRKVYLFEGIVLGIILTVFLMGSVYILSILDSRFWFCLEISVSTTVLMMIYICDIYSISWKVKMKVSMVFRF